MADTPHLDVEDEARRRSLEIIERGLKDDDSGMILEDFARLQGFPLDSD